MITCAEMCGERAAEVLRRGSIRENGSSSLPHGWFRAGLQGLVRQIDEIVKDDHVPFLEKGYPAIDLIDGKAVRLFQGDYDQMTVFGDDPTLIARLEADLPATGDDFQVIWP